MATSYPSIISLTVDDDERYRSDDVYYQPYYYDNEQNPERNDTAMMRTAQYISGLNPKGDSFLTDDHPQHNHQHHHHPHITDALPALTIRRHTPGSTDPAFQKLPTNLQPTSENISSSSNVHVTIQRNEVIPDQTIIQPLFYPVAVYVNNPVQQMFDDRPIQPMIILPKPPSPNIPSYYPEPPKVDETLFRPIQPMITLPKPPSPKIPSYYPEPPKLDETLFKPIKPRHKPPLPKKPSPPPPPPVSSHRYESESFHLPPSRNRNTNVSPRRPIRVDVVPTTPLELKPEKIRPARVVVEEYDGYDEYYRAPSVYSKPQKVVSYRSAPNMTTREMQNDEMENPEYPVDVQSPPLRTVTYRK